MALHELVLWLWRDMRQGWIWILDQALDPPRGHEVYWTCSWFLWRIPWCKDGMSTPSRMEWQFRSWSFHLTECPMPASCLRRRCRLSWARPSNSLLTTLPVSHRKRTPSLLQLWEKIVLHRMVLLYILEILKTHTHDMYVDSIRFHVSQSKDSGRQDYPYHLSFIASLRILSMAWHNLCSIWDGVMMVKAG